MKLFEYGPSQNCFKVRLLAAHLGLDLELVPVSIFEGEGAEMWFLQKNPMGGVPVLETDDGSCLPESNAILAYLAQGTPYLPDDTFARAQVIRWMMFEQRYVQTSVSRLRYWTLTHKREAFVAEIPTAEKLANRSLDILDQELAGRPFIVGDTYTIADMSLFAYTHVATDAGFDLDMRPGLRRWLDCVRQQPGFEGEVIPYSADPFSKGKLPFAV